MQVLEKISRSTVDFTENQTKDSQSTSNNSSPKRKVSLSRVPIGIFDFNITAEEKVFYYYCMAANKNIF